MLYINYLIKFFKSVTKLQQIYLRLAIFKEMKILNMKINYVFCPALVPIFSTRDATPSWPNNNGAFIQLLIGNATKRVHFRQNEVRCMLFC